MMNENLIKLLNEAHNEIKNSFEEGMSFTAKDVLSYALLMKIAAQKLEEFNKDTR